MTEPPTTLHDEIRQVGDFRLRRSRMGQPADWTFIQLLNINGMVLFSGVLREDEVPLEVVIQLERGRAYAAATRKDV